MHISIYSYLDYRKYLSDIFQSKRNQTNFFSLEQLSKKSGCLSKSHLSLILSGKRNMPEQSIIKIGKALGLTNAEIKFFSYLVSYNQSKNDYSKEQYLKLILSEIQKRSEANLSIESYRILEDWYYLVIRELTRIPDFDPHPNAISLRLNKLVTSQQAKKAMTVLLETGLIEETEVGLKPTNHTIRTSDEISNLAIRKYHKSCLDLGKEAIEKFPIEAREFGSVNLLIDENDIPKLKDLIKTFREQVLNLATKKAEQETSIVQVNVQMINLTYKENLK